MFQRDLDPNAFEKCQQMNWHPHFCWKWHLK